MRFSEILINERKKRGWSQETVAQKLNISRQSISKWENDESYPDLPKLIKLSEILDISLDELCGKTYSQIDTIKTKSPLNIIILLSILMILSFFLGRLSINESNLDMNDFQLLELKIIYEQIDDSFHVSFVPNIIDEKITYKVELIYDNDTKLYETNKSGSKYEAICKASFEPGPYHLNIIIAKGKSSVILPITTNLYGEGVHTSYTSLQ